MKRKTLYLNLVAAALLVAGGAAQAANTVTLRESVRLQMLEAQAGIQAEMRANVKAQARVLDVPGVEVGRIELADGEEVAEPQSAGPQADAATDIALRLDVALRALEAPGMFGVYRYLSATALNAAIIVAE